MTTPKKPPNLTAAVEADVSSDLRKVGGFFRGLWKFTEKAEKAVRVVTSEEEPEASRARLPRAAAGAREMIVVEPSSCDVCGGTRLVGGAKKVPCPACAKT